MKDIYVIPELEIVMITSEDIITTSNREEDELPFVPYNENTF